VKVLFVSSGDRASSDISPFIRAQGESLRQKGVDVSFFPVWGKGPRGYLQGVRELKNYLRDHRFDLIHAHYTLCGWVAVFASGSTPVVLTLMGNDAYGEYVGVSKVAPASRWLTAATWMIQPFVNVLISKSPNIERFVYRKRVSHVIPNGVRLSQFALYPEGCRRELGLRDDKRYVLFLGNPSDVRKNYELAAQAVELLGRPDVELLTPFPVSHDTVVKYFNSVDVFVLCSFMEGSPNVVKEAMACNCPLVATDVGDAAWVIGNTPGCHVASFDPRDFSHKLARALQYAENHGRTRGRKRLLELGLDAGHVADRIIDVYQQTLKKQSDRWLMAPLLPCCIEPLVH
jgi:glycosyltransferase involved in cell wall biosynthesis